MSGMFAVARLRADDGMSDPRQLPNDPVRRLALELATTGGAHRHPRASPLGPAAASGDVAVRQMSGTDKEEQMSKVATSTRVRSWSARSAAR